MAKPSPFATHPLAMTLFCVAWSSMALSYAWFALSVCPRAFDAWMRGRGILIIEKKNAGPIKKSRQGLTTTQNLYWVIAVDQMGKLQHGWVIVGRRWWPALSVATCPVACRWDVPGGSADWDLLDIF